MLLDFNVVYKNIVKANNNYIDLTSDNNNIKFIEDTRQGYYYSKDKEIPIAIEYYEKNAEHILREYIIRISYMKFKYENPEYDVFEKKKELTNEINNVLYSRLIYHSKMEQNNVKYDFYNSANNNEPIKKLYFPLKIFDIQGILLNTIYIESMRLMYMDKEFWNIFFLDNRFSSDDGLYILPEESFESIKLFMDLIHYGDNKILINTDIDTCISLKNFLSRFSNKVLDPLKIYLDDRICLYQKLFDSTISSDYLLEIYLEYVKERNSLFGHGYVGPSFDCIPYLEDS